VHVRNTLHGLIEELAADALRDVVDKDVKKLLVLRSKKIKRKKVVTEVISELVDLLGYELRDIGHTNLAALLLVVLEHASSLSVGKLLKTDHDVGSELLLDRDELLVGHGKTTKDLIRRRDHTALVGGGVTEQKDTAVLEVLTSISSDVKVSTLNHDRARRLAVDHEVFHVGHGKSTRTTTARKEDIDLGLVDIGTPKVESKVGRDPFLNNLTVLLADAKDFLHQRRRLTSLAHAKDPATLVELLERIFVHHLDLLEEVLELLIVEALRIIAGTRTISDSKKMALREVTFKELHEVTSNITIWATRHLKSEVLAHASELDSLLEVLESTPGGHTVFLVVDTSFLLTRDESTLDEVAHLDGLLGKPVSETIMEVLIRTKIDVFRNVEVINDTVVVLHLLLLEVPNDKSKEGGKEHTLILVHVLKGHVLLELGNSLIDFLLSLASSEHFLASHLHLLRELNIGVQEADRLGTTLRDILVLLLLSVSKVVALSEHVGTLIALMLKIVGANSTHTTTSKITETDVHTHVGTTTDEEDTIRKLRELLLTVEARNVIKVGRVDTEADAELVISIDVGTKDVLSQVESLDEDSTTTVIVLLAASIELGKLVLESSLEFLVLGIVVETRMETGLEDLDEVLSKSRMEAEGLHDAVLVVHSGVDLSKDLLNEGSESTEEVSLVGADDLLLNKTSESVEATEGLEHFELTHEALDLIGLVGIVAKELDATNKDALSGKRIDIGEAAGTHLHAVVTEGDCKTIEEEALGDILPGKVDHLAVLAVNHFGEDLIMSLSLLDELLLNTVGHGNSALGVVDAGEVHTSDAKRKIIAREVSLGDVLAVLTDTSLSVVLEDLLIAVLTLKRDNNGTSLETEVKVLLKLLAVNESVSNNLTLLCRDFLLETLAHIGLKPLLHCCISLFHL